MRFRPANISLINRRHYLPRLLLTLSSKYNDKNNPSDSQILTGSHHINLRVAVICPECCSDHYEAHSCASGQNS
jgi:hypothetical protein